MKAPNISVVVPILNEEGNVSLLHQKVRDVIESIGLTFELILVDDGSTDRSVENIKELHRKDPRVKLVSFTRNFGHQVALSAGMDYASGDAVIVMDADLQHPPELILKMISYWKDGYEVVYTVREKTEKISAFKKWSSSLYYRFFRKMTGIDLPPNAADFRLMDRSVILAFRTIKERSRFLRGLTFWLGFKSIGLPYYAAQRHSGKTKYNFRKMFTFAVDGIVSFSSFPLYLAIYLGFAISSLGFFYLLYVIYAKFVAHSVVAGWTSLITFTAFVGGIQLFVIGVIGVYLGKIYEEVKQRPLYLVKRTIGLSVENNIGVRNEKANIEMDRV